MRIDKNDPRITAYILGELDGMEMREFDALLRSCEESRDYVESLEQTSFLLEKELHKQPVLGLSGEQRRKVEEQARTTVPVGDNGRRSPFRWLIALGPTWQIGLATATVALIATIGFQTLQVERPALDAHEAKVARTDEIEPEEIPAARVSHEEKVITLDGIKDQQILAVPLGEISDQPADTTESALPQVAKADDSEPRPGLKPRGYANEVQSSRLNGGDRTVSEEPGQPVAVAEAEKSPPQAPAREVKGEVEAGVLGPQVALSTREELVADYAFAGDPVLSATDTESVLFEKMAPWVFIEYYQGSSRKSGVFLNTETHEKSPQVAVGDLLHGATVELLDSTAAVLRLGDATQVLALVPDHSPGTHPIFAVTGEQVAGDKLALGISSDGNQKGVPADEGWTAEFSDGLAEAEVPSRSEAEALIQESLRQTRDQLARAQSQPAPAPPQPAAPRPALEDRYFVLDSAGGGQNPKPGESIGRTSGSVAEGDPNLSSLSAEGRSLAEEAAPVDGGIGGNIRGRVPRLGYIQGFTPLVTQSESEASTAAGTSNLVLDLDDDGIVQNDSSALPRQVSLEQAPAPAVSGGLGGGLGDITIRKESAVAGKDTGYYVLDSFGGRHRASITGNQVYWGDRGAVDHPEPSLSYPGTEDYDKVEENPFKRVAEEPLSTFSIDVDTASYSNMRRFLNQGQLPPRDSIRIEEWINYFSYDYEAPSGEHPFNAQVEVNACPWNPDHLLARIGIKGSVVQADDRGPANLVFLIDVSGSMQPANKLPLLKQAMLMLLKQLREDDRVAIVTYAGSSQVVLESTKVKHSPKIEAAIESLNSGGSTNGESGIRMAYDQATANLIEKGINRVILATDGDFNVGVTDRTELIDMLKDRARKGIFLSIFGFGMGNLKDGTLEQLADQGNGHYGYIDNLQEARKVFVEELAGTLVTIAKDVKLQVDFNPAKVAAYRLIGYDNRILAAQDFNDDTKDAGEIGAGHTVTALYELVPPGKEGGLGGVEPSKYAPQPAPTPIPEATSPELLTVRIRYKQPDQDKSVRFDTPVLPPRAAGVYAEPSADYKFAASVAAFGMLLEDSRYSGQNSYETVLDLARQGRGEDAEGYRAEFVRLVELARSLSGK